MTLRARVLAGAALIAVVLAVGAVVTTRTTEDHLLEQVDAQLAAAGGPGREPSFEGRPGFDRLSEVYAGVVTRAGVRTVATPDLTGEDLSPPAFDVDQVLAAAATGDPFTVAAADGDLRYRARADTGRRGTTFVLAVPLADVDTAVDRLVAVEVGTTVAVLAVVALVAWWVVHLGVRPIKQMTETAAAIAAGDLTRRVPDGVAAGTEAAELGQALNVMLDERTRSEERLRRFAADASHELRTPITTIRGYAELYRAGGLGEGGELDEAMRRTEQEAVRMGSLVDDLLQLARLDQGRPLGREAVDLAAVAADAVRDAGAVAPERPISFDAATRPLVVLGDEDRLRQVVANVVGNALVHTADGVAVDVRVGREGDRAVLEVVDHGAGMAPDVAARAFERFYRADASRSRHRGGSGLGLSIVRAVVEAHGGSVDLDSEPGRGTSVRLALPLADPG